MKVLVDIPDKYYNDICNSETASSYSVLYALDGIRKGKTIEPFTDTEQRIFLAAMGREKETCKKEDEWDVRANLVLVCGRILRKVRATLWQ